MNAYIFVAAAVFAVVPLVIILKMTINKLIKNPKDINAIFRRFFIGVALSKIVPIILLIFGMIKMTKGMDISNLYIPWAIIFIVLAYSVSFISGQKNLDVPKGTQVQVDTLTSIAKPLLFSIPLMAAVFLFMMTL